MVHLVYSNNKQEKLNKILDDSKTIIIKKTVEERYCITKYLNLGAKV